MTTCGLLRVDTMRLSLCVLVTISKIEPKRRVIPQYAPNFAEDANFIFDEKLRCRLKPMSASPRVAALTELSLLNFRSQPRYALLDGLFLIATITRMIPSRFAGMVGGINSDLATPFMFASIIATPNRMWNAVISQSPIWRRCHSTMGGFVRLHSQHFAAITMKDCHGHVVGPANPFTSFPVHHSS